MYSVQTLAFMLNCDPQKVVTRGSYVIIERKAFSTSFYGNRTWTSEELASLFGQLKAIMEKWEKEIWIWERIEISGRQVDHFSNNPAEEQRNKLEWQRLAALIEALSCNEHGNLSLRCGEKGCEICQSEEDAAAEYDYTVEYPLLRPTEEDIA